MYDAKSGPRVACTGGDIADIIYFTTEVSKDDARVVAMVTVEGVCGSHGDS